MLSFVVGAVHQMVMEEERMDFMMAVLKSIIIGLGSFFFLSCHRH